MNVADSVLIWAEKVQALLEVVGDVDPQVDISQLRRDVEKLSYLIIELTTIGEREKAAEILERAQNEYINLGLSVGKY